MKKASIFSLITLAFVYSQCNDSKAPDRFSVVKEEVLKLHDETMEAHGTLMQLSAQLKNKAADTSLPNLILLDSIRTELDGLQADMMDWMAQFDEPETSSPETIQYLESQSAVLQKLKESQIQQIKVATELVK
jgi:hypothetical protein